MRSCEKVPIIDLPKSRITGQVSVLSCQSKGIRLDSFSFRSCDPLASFPESFASPQKKEWEHKSP